jgi:hypothetical protein
MVATTSSGTDPRRSFGAGVPLAQLAIVLSISVAVFLGWGGLLWRAPAGASHVGRIALSYLIVVPLVAALLLVERRFTATSLATSVGLVWAAKLVLTASLYPLLAPESASHYEPAAVPAASSVEVEPPYREARGAVALGDLAGVVMRDGAPVAGAAVVVVRPPPGIAAPAPSEATWTLASGTHDTPVHLVYEADRVTVVNRDASLHTLVAARGDERAWNVSVPAGGSARAPVPAPGVYALSCASHGAERATLVVVDHPYAAITGADGRFVLGRIPAGAREVAVVLETGATIRAVAEITAGGRTELTLDASSNEGDE